MSELIDTTQMYLRTILELEEEDIVPMRVRIVERLGHSGPTVSQTVSRMERDGLLSLTNNRELRLTDEGRAVATSVMRKHRLAERLLVDVLGMPWEEVHDEACRWEHVMSEAVEEKILKLIAGPERSPFGNAIPALGELGGPEVSENVDAVSLPDAVQGGPVKAEVVRMGEYVQAERECIGLLAGAGVLPGRVVRAEALDEGVSVAAEGADPAEAVHLAEDLAAVIHVRPL